MTDLGFTIQWPKGVPFIRPDDMSLPPRLATDEEVALWREVEWLTTLLGVSESLAVELSTIHAEYFDLNGTPGVDDTTPEPEDVWRYDRDFREVLAEPAPAPVTVDSEALAERIAQAIEADGPDGFFFGETAEGYVIGQEFAARIARSFAEPAPDSEGGAQ